MRPTAQTLPTDNQSWLTQHAAACHLHLCRPPRHPTCAACIQSPFQSPFQTLPMSGILLLDASLTWSHSTEERLLCDSACLPLTPIGTGAICLTLLSPTLRQTLTTLRCEEICSSGIAPRRDAEPLPTASKTVHRGRGLHRAFLIRDVISLYPSASVFPSALSHLQLHSLPLMTVVIDCIDKATARLNSYIVAPREENCHMAGGVKSQLQQ